MKYINLLLGFALVWLFYHHATAQEFTVNELIFVFVFAILGELSEINGKLK